MIYRHGISQMADLSSKSYDLSVLQFFQHSFISRGLENFPGEPGMHFTHQNSTKSDLLNMSSIVPQSSTFSLTSATKMKRKRVNV